MKKIIDFKGLIIGGTFLLVMSGLGAWLFGMPYWQALLIGFACLVILGVIAAFENGADQQNENRQGPEK
jgi:membrane protein implicated in regulation of membrane protease activity